MSNIADLKKKLVGDIAQSVGGQATVNQLTDFYVTYEKASADAQADTATADTLFWTNPYDYTVYVVSGRIVSASTLTAHADNNAVITVGTDDGAAGTITAALTWTTSVAGTGNWAAKVAENNTATTAAACAVVAGASMYFKIAKGGTGVVVPASIVQVRMRRGEY